MLVVGRGEGGVVCVCVWIFFLRGYVLTPRCRCTPTYKLTTYTYAYIYAYILAWAKYEQRDVGLSGGGGGEGGWGETETHHATDSKMLPTHHTYNQTSLWSGENFTPLFFIYFLTKQNCVCIFFFKKKRQGGSACLQEEGN